MSNSTKRSPEALVYRSWYNTTRWRNLRRNHLRKSPWCVDCLKVNKKVVASVCDHIHPHKGNAVFFWNGPFQSLCYYHHNVVKQQLEKRGFSGEVDVEGWPVDPKHPVNR